MALRVHRSIQERDIKVGRNLGNWILRWLDKKRPQAQIRAGHSHSCSANTSRSKQLTNSSNQKTPGSSYPTSGPRTGERESGRQLFTSTRNVLPRAFPTVAMIWRNAKTAGIRHFCISSPGSSELHNRPFGAEGVIRKDILQWMRHH